MATTPPVYDKHSMLYGEEGSASRHSKPAGESGLPAAQPRLLRRLLSGLGRGHWPVGKPPLPRRRRDRGTRLAGWRAARAQTRRAARAPAQCRAAPVRRSGASSREGLPQPPRVVFYSRRPQARITDAEPDRASMWRVACRTTPRHMPSGASAHDPNPSASQGARPSAATPPPTAAGHWCSTLQQTVNTIQGERTPPS